VPPGTRLSITPGDHGTPAAHIETEHYALKAASSALEAVYGVKPLVVRMGATVPIMELFKRRMGIDTVYFSFSTSDEDYHAPNEFFRVNRLREGTASWAHLLDILGRGR
jgi:acetylornithine deacetylase/succinyl-diaminopimelate desuccinylase-like protein